METLASQLDIVGEEAWWKAYNEANRVFEEIRARRTERRKKLQQAAISSARNGPTPSTTTSFIAPELAFADHQDSSPAEAVDTREEKEQQSTKQPQPTVHSADYAATAAIRKKLCGRAASARYCNTMGKAVPNGSGEYFLGVNFPQLSMQQVMDALCLRGDDGASTETLKTLCCEALGSRIEFLSWLWRREPRKRGKKAMLWDDFYIIVTSNEQKIRLQRSTSECDPADFHSVVFLAARLAAELHHHLQANLEERRSISIDGTVHDKRTSYPVVQQAYTKAHKQPGDRYWRLLFVLVKFVCKMASPGYFLDRKAALPANSHLHQQVSAFRAGRLLPTS